MMTTRKATLQSSSPRTAGIILRKGTLRTTQAWNTEAGKKGEKKRRKKLDGMLYHIHECGELRNPKRKRKKLKRGRAGWEKCGEDPLRVGHQIVIVTDDVAVFQVAQ